MTTQSDFIEVGADFIEHYGKQGMRWGHRNASSGEAKAAKPSGKERDTQIRLARLNTKADRVNFKSQKALVKATAKGSAARAKGEKELAKTKATMLKNPDRVTAVKLTRGEKAVSIIGLNQGGLGVLLASSIASRRIAKKQMQGSYDQP